MFGTPRASVLRVRAGRPGEENKMNIQEAKRALLTKARDLSRGSVSKDEIAIEQTAEMLDTIQQTADRELALECLSRNWKTGTLVAEALQRINKGTFGLCAECEEQIGDRRLRALPWAKYCITCQERADRVGAPAANEFEVLAA